MVDGDRRGIKRGRGDNFEMKDFKARNRSHFIKRVYAHEGHYTTVAQP